MPEGNWYCPVCAFIDDSPTEAGSTDDEVEEVEDGEEEEEEAVSTSQSDDDGKSDEDDDSFISEGSDDYEVKKCFTSSKNHTLIL